MPQYRTFVPKNVDLSNKELKIRVEDELKNLLEDIRASVDVYPGDEPQYQQEIGVFISDKPQEVSLEEYPNIQKLFKSFIASDILQGGGRPLYEPKQIEQFLAGTKQFYRESTDLTTEGHFDVNIISELGFSSSPDKLKNFLKDVGVVGQTGLSRGLREVFRYFTGTFQDTGLTPISATYQGRNPELHNTLKSLPFLESVSEGRFIVKLLTRPEDTKTIFLDATDLVPVYEKYMNIKPGAARTLPEQMQYIEDMKGTGTVRSMIDPSRQVQPLEKQEQRDILRYLVHEYSTDKDRQRQRREIRDPDYDPVLLEKIDQKAKERKTVTFQPDPEEAAPFVEGDSGDAYTYDPDDPALGSEEELDVLDAVPDMGFGGDQEPEEEELKKIPVPIKPKKAAKPSGSGSSLAERLRQRAEARLKAADQKAAKRLGIPYDPERTTAKKPDPRGGQPDPKNVKGFGLFWMLEQLLHSVPGMGLVDEEGRPVATLDEQMNKLTG